MLIGPRRHALAGLLATLLMSIVTDLNAQQGPATAISVQGSEIGGVVSGPAGRKQVSGLLLKPPIYRLATQKSSSPMIAGVIYLTFRKLTTLSGYEDTD